MNLPSILLFDTVPLITASYATIGIIIVSLLSVTPSRSNLSSPFMSVTVEESLVVLLTSNRKGTFLFSATSSSPNQVPDCSLFVLLCCVHEDITIISAMKINNLLYFISCFNWVIYKSIIINMYLYL